MQRLPKYLKRIWFGCIFLPAVLSAQKFHFQNYNVQQGLIQSQVFCITQDHFDNLWFCTLGGISRFDGKVFTNYSETDGLISNYANCIMADHKSNMWIGTSYGASKFNGAGFKNYRFSDKPDGDMVRSIQEDSMHRIWVLSGGRLYLIANDEKPVLNPVTGSNEKLSAIDIDRQGRLWANVLREGIFRLENDGWKMVIPLTEFNEMGIFQKMLFDPADSGRFYLMSTKGIFSADHGKISPVVKEENVGKFMNMYMDKSDKLWFTSTRGLFQYADSGLTAFNPGNGYEGTNTNVIFQDREDNIWFGTNGTGVFRYSYQPFLIFDQFNATRNTNVMPMLTVNDRLYLGTDGAGVFVYDGKEMSFLKGWSDNPSDQNITGLYKGPGNDIYILASSGLFTKYAGGKMAKIELGDLKGCITDVLPDDKGGFWVASCMSFVYITPEGKTVRVLNSFTKGILSLSTDSLLVTSDAGLYKVGKDFGYRKISDSLLITSRCMAMSSLGNYYLMATSNKGVVIYNGVTGQHRQFTKKDGLNSDFIYSIVTDHKSRIWVGTGRGINKIDFDTSSEKAKISSLSIPGDISSSESNERAAVYDAHNNLWVGTVSGLFKYFPDSGKKQTYLPPVVLQQVQVFSKEIPSSRYSGLLDNWYAVPKNLSLPHNENHLSFSFRCLSYLHNESISYQYQLEGMEKSYSPLTTDHFVVYPMLPPGHYTFRARAFIAGVGYSTKNVDFTFDIKAAFYQTLYFKFLMLLFVMGLILWIQWLRIRMQQKRIHQIEEVKREENIKVRQTASEDFHDEVGNSLTRIQVLTDVLQTKLGNGHDEEKRLIGQIKENVSGLYQGTRDILWALNPESDSIKEIGHRLESLGIDVFQDTGICFSYEHILDPDNVKLPGNFNRNIMMIFKEAMSNCLKHGQAHQVKLTIQKTGLQEIMIELADDGIGFNPLYIKKGHGFQNMQKRANRMNAVFSIHSSPGQGARYELRIPVSGV
jgi:signal transduction histidine kinase/ligand-binding sensor domain-containing protein